MAIRTRVLSGTALSAFAGTVLLAATALAQDQGASGAGPTSGTNAQPSAAEPGQTAQPYSTPQNAPQQMNSQQMNSSPSSATMSASAGEPVTKVKNAKTKLASASVQDATGQPIGQVASVHTTKKGTPTTIDISLQSTGGLAKTVAIKASKLRFDQSSNTLKTNLTSQEVQSLPAATGM